MIELWIELRMRVKLFDSVEKRIMRGREKGNEVVQMEQIVFFSDNEVNDE